MADRSIFGARFYTHVKPLVPKRVRVFARRKYVARVLKRGVSWPIEPSVSQPPVGWTGWPHGKRFAFVITHDVESARGHDACRSLAALEMKWGFRSSFNFTPGNYRVDPDLRRFLHERGFEVGLHGLTHNGNLFRSKEYFGRRVGAINRYLEEWGAVGFRSPSMYHDLDMLHELKIEYDCSTFDVDPFEPQPDGVGTIFPFWCRDGSNGSGYVELPYTLPQDHLVFVLLGERTNNIWKKKLKWVAENGGMALFIAHPDYMAPEGRKCRIDQYPVQLYEQFLGFVREEYKDEYWHALPREVARFYRREVVAGSDGPAQEGRREAEL